jgi:hypothetical protein
MNVTGGGTAVLAGLVSAYHEVMGENSGLSHDEQYSTALTVEDFRANIAEVDDRIAAAASRAGRDRAEIELLPVSKTVPQERIRLAVAAGCHKLGENKVQEAHRKSEEMADLDIDWSVIGHLQSNKAKDVARFASEFQALDRIKVARALDRRLQGEGRSLDTCRSTPPPRTRNSVCRPKSSWASSGTSVSSTRSRFRA